MARVQSLIRMDRELRDTYSVAAQARGISFNALVNLVLERGANDLVPVDEIEVFRNAPGKPNA
jgi:hypothetical protein